VGLGKTQVHERTGHKTTAKISVHIFSYGIQAGPELSGTEASGDHLDSFILVPGAGTISEDLLRAVATSTLARVLCFLPRWIVAGKAHLTEYAVSGYLVGLTPHSQSGHESVFGEIRATAVLYSSGVRGKRASIRQ
jgi:hypothetical protein